METRYLPDNIRYRTMTTKELRASFLIDTLFEPGKLALIYTNVDRAIVGSAVPAGSSLTLEAGKEIASSYFTERREVGVINIGDAGAIRVDDASFEMANCDFLYIGRGSKTVEFSSKDKTRPAQFYILSYPAHTKHQTAHVPQSECVSSTLGTSAEANKRTIYKAIHPGGVKSCQLVMGLTVLHEGSIWNTMAAHTHERRSEVYMYFDFPKEAVVVHFMGLPDETRHIILRDRQVVLSPSWSIHSGAGTRNYKFVWGMGGENQEFGDMDHVSMDTLL